MIEIHLDGEGVDRAGPLGRHQRDDRRADEILAHGEAQDEIVGVGELELSLNAGVRERDFRLVALSAGDRQDPLERDSVDQHPELG